MQACYCSANARSTTKSPGFVVFPSWNPRASSIFFGSRSIAGLPHGITRSLAVSSGGTPALTTQHVCNTFADMKTAILPQVRVEPQLRADLEAVLREGETLSDFLEATVRQAVDYRRMQAELDARADAAWVRFQQTGAAVPASEVLAEMRERLESRRRKLQRKHRPAKA